MRLTWTSSLGAAAILTSLLVACGSQAPDSFPPVSARPSATESTSAELPGSSLANGQALTVESFAEVVAEALQVRVGPGLGSEVLELDCYGYPAPGCPPAVVGRNTSSTVVFLLDGPVAADGYDWYLVADATSNAYGGIVGWVAAGDAEDAWLVPKSVTCPTPPIELADVTPMTGFARLHCFGGEEMTLRGYAAEPPTDAFEWTGRSVLVWPGEFSDNGDRLIVYLAPGLGQALHTPSWVEIIGGFGMPATEEWCGPAALESAPIVRLPPDTQCRTFFAATSIDGL
jgi:hypothetical protein